ncbi:uncharacterized protein [Rutidosis leptorrhynchoides]|uniref:uncharacterized protein n=1 Tax=Rutidosis leptorrhynchoides TaxID=125765 RepID=UPI003A9A2F39
MASPSEELRNRDDTPTVKEMMHKTKLIQFFGRTTPIILQNDNGPCPLLAICNVLLLKNNLSLDSDVTEVSQEKLLQLVAGRLIDSNSNNDNKDAGYVENQEQNIADAIDLLPRLTTGIDVNIKFTRIYDFEFTRECAIFDLLDIPLCHGWIVDPQDYETSNAIGSKSYNTLMGELVALETQNMESVSKKNPQESSVDFVATKENLEVTVTDEQIKRGDLEEETEILRALKLSETDNPITAEENVSTNTNGENISPVKNDCDDLITFETVPGDINDSVPGKNESKDGTEKTSIEDLDKTVNKPLSLIGSSSSLDVDQSSLNANVNEVEKINIGEKTSTEPCSLAPNAILESPKSMTSDSLISTADEPICEDKCVLKTRTSTNEGGVVMSEQEDKDSTNADVTRPRDGTTSRQGELIKNFLKNSASQLTIYGLFSLQAEIKERELCVFFRNNHFNTMFKFEGELYILATDLGYINQPDLVWEKLNEVNGDTVFVDSNFKKFKPDNHERGSWDEQNAMANTADYLAKMDSSAQGDTNFNTDLQLAIALQQQEFEQQQQQEQPQREQPQRVLPKSPTTSRSGLVVGPQHVHPSRPRNSSSSSRQESKPSKEKCIVM